MDGGLRPMFRKQLRDYFWVVIETPMSGGGVPDHYWCSSGISGWNEYKATSGMVVRFRPEQIGWHSAYARHGGRSFIIIRRQNRDADEIYIYKGSDADPNMMKKTPWVYAADGGPKMWNWEVISSVLRTAK
jgi:hypothetical protein